MSMYKLFVSLLCVCFVALLLGSLAGCGARYEFAKDQVLAQVDLRLGKTEVERKQAEISIRNLQNAVDTLAEGKNRARVQAEQYGQKVEAWTRKTQELESCLKTLRDHLRNASTIPVILAGKPYTQDELEALADKLIQAYKTASSELESMKRSQANLDRAASALEEQHQQARARLTALENRYEELQANFQEVKVLREAREQAGDSAKTLEASLTSLEKQMDDLYV